MTAYAFLLARFLHVIAGAVWVGGIVFLYVILMPSIRAAGLSGSEVLAQVIRVRRLPMVLMSLAILTLLSGLSLFYLDIRAFGPAWTHTGPGRTFSLGAAFATIAIIIGMAVSSPASRKLGALSDTIRASGAPPSREQSAALGQLQSLLATTGKLVTSLLLLAVTCMGVARYIP